MKFCRVCDSPIEPFMSFGKMPVANAFISEKEFNNEYFFDLNPASCSSCHTFQIVDVPEQEKMFHDHYAYFASTSSIMTKHFKTLSEEVLKDHIKTDDPLIVEIGSNDGISLQHYSKLGIRHLGIDPSQNVVDASRKKGISTVCDFFNRQSAEKIIDQNGKADIIIATNTMHHISNIREVVSGAKILLKKGGLMITEDPYLADMISLNSYEQIYAEHNFIWSVSSMKYLFNLYDMEIINVIPNKYHGGCLRYYLAHKGSYRVKQSVGLYLDKERNIGLLEQNIYKKFHHLCKASRQNILKLIDKTKNNGKNIVGYGATAKSSTLINYCGLTKEHIDYICDSTPAKQGLFSPGAHIPVVSPIEFSNKYPDYSILFAWNHKKEIFQKEKNYLDQGGKWIEYVPKINIT
tara:strand:+ start:1846 stop:3063 length:1218 start_codon:yes stop_codon:yes gene_type:complete